MKKGSWLGWSDTLQFPTKTWSEMSKHIKKYTALHIKLMKKLLLWLFARSRLENKFIVSALWKKPPSFSETHGFFYDRFSCRNRSFPFYIWNNPALISRGCSFSGNSCNSANSSLPKWDLIGICSSGRRKIDAGESQKGSRGRW